MRKLIFISLLILFTANVATASLQYWSGYNWRTIQTEHFRIHYHQGEREIGYRTAVIAEQTLAVLSPRLRHMPKGRIELVLSDDVDLSNGSSTGFPQNTVRVYIKTPHPSIILDDYDDWLKALLTHELTHTLHMDMARGIPWALRAVMGRIIMPNHINPVFAVEGLAVWDETALSERGGRARSVAGEMTVREEWETGKFPGLDQIANWTREWPSGARPYVLGGVFHKWVADNYDNDVWPDIAHKHSGQIWPFLHDHNMKLSTGQKQTWLYKRWGESLDRKYTALKSGLEELGVTRSIQLTKLGRNNLRPMFSPDGATLYYEENSLFREGRIQSIDLVNFKIKNRKTAGTTGDTTVLPNGDIVYAVTDDYQVLKSYYDLYLIKNGSKRRHRIAHALRSRDICAMPDGKRILFISNELDRPTLGLLDLETEKTEVLFTVRPEDDFIQLAQPAISPDGKTAAMSVWHMDGNLDIFLFDMESRTFRRVTFDYDRDISPAFSPDGRYLLFTSGRSRIYNLYALDLKGDKLYQVTRVFGGAFDPTVSPDQKQIAFSYYGPKGYDIHLMPFVPDSWEQVQYVPLPDKRFGKCILGKELAEKGQDAENKYEDKKYAAWRTIWPRYWLPNIAVVDGAAGLGVETSGYDVLMHHVYSLAGNYSWDSEFFGYDVSYTNAMFHPNFTLSHSQVAVNYGPILRDGEGNSMDYWEKRLSGQFSMFYSLDGSNGVFAGYTIQDRGRLSDIPEEMNVFLEEGLYSGLYGGWLFDNSAEYLESIGEAAGAKASITYTAYSKIFGSDFEVRTLLGSFYKYTSLPGWYHLIAARFSGGFAEGETLYLKAFRLGGYNNDQLLVKASENSVFLRGYNRSAQRGQRVAASSLEYRILVWRPGRGIWAWPIFLDDVSFVAFGDAGTAWDDMVDENDKILTSTGGELHIRTNLAYYYSFHLRLGLAYGFQDTDVTGGLHYIMTFGSSF